MNNIDISYINPTFTENAKADEVALKIPFVGIYNSILDSDIEYAIERDMEWYNDNDEPMPTACKVDLRAIYEDYFNAVTCILGWDSTVCRLGAIYSPLYYNCMDDTIYALVKRDIIVKLCKKYDLDPNKDEELDELPYAIIRDLNSRDIIDISEEYDPLDNNDIQNWLYNTWNDGVLPNGGWSYGYETINNNLEFICPEDSEKNLD